MVVAVACKLTETSPRLKFKESFESLQSFSLPKGSNTSNSIVVVHPFAPSVLNMLSWLTLLQNTPIPPTAILVAIDAPSVCMFMHVCVYPCHTSGMQATCGYSTMCNSSCACHTHGQVPALPYIYTQHSALFYKSGRRLLLCPLIPLQNTPIPPTTILVAIDAPTSIFLKMKAFSTPLS